MKRSRRFVVPLAVAAQLACSVMAWAQGAYKVQPASLPADLPAALAAALLPQGNQVVDSTGAVFCEVWWGKAIPTKAGGGASGDLLYGSLEVGTLVGALHFPKAGSDFRGQNIKPGYYSLRYALIPQDGNHMGVNPTRDFLLMSPAALDTNPGQIVALNDLYILSRKASGSNHPAILTMSAPSGNAKTGSLTQDDQGHWIFEANGKTAGGQDLPLAVVVVGQTAAQ
ncbi:MAG: hypothetical protein ABSB82_18380 [Terriglobia bacterium]|jgi:hypothetical protein